MREAADRFLAFEGKFARLVIHDANGADGKSVRRHQRHGAIKPEEGIANDKGEILVIVVLFQIGDEHQLGAADGHRTEGDLARATFEFLRQTVFRLEPETVVLDKADIGNRAVAYLCGKLADFLKGRFYRCIHYTVGAQGLIAFRFVFWGRVGQYQRLL